MDKSKSSEKAHVREAASELLNEGKKLADEYYNEGKKVANDYYDQGINKINEAEEHVKEYTDNLLKKVQEHPLKSILIAGGIGYLLSKILK